MINAVASLPGWKTCRLLCRGAIAIGRLTLETHAAMNGPIRYFSRLYQTIAHSPNIFAPASAPAHDIFRLSMFVLAITLGIFLTVSGLLLYVLLRFRERVDDNGREPAQVYGSNQIELSWTIIPVLIVMVLFLTTVRVILEIEHTREPAGALNVIVVGHQFWWEFRYPQYGIVTANELHVPVSDEANNPRPTYLTLLTADVNHSFWVPRLAGKTDLIANRVNSMWIQPETADLYLGQCAEYCGLQHAHMLLRVYAQSPADFERWVEQQQQKAVQDPSGAEGRAVFERNACINCHTIAGTVATGRFGPDLTHLMSRDTIASGTVPNTRDDLRKWIENPDSLKPGALMPAMKLDDHDLNAIASYLITLH
jgi:cytochrome c oxidase subunit II